MRVLLIHNAYNHQGGEDKIFEHEKKLLIDNGVNVRALSFDNDNLNLLTLHYNRNSSKVVRKEIRSFQPDLVHIHNLFYKASPSIISTVKDENIPVIVTLHNFRLICTGALLMRNNKVCEKCVQQKLPIYPSIYACFQDSKINSTVLTSIIGLHKYLKTWNKVDKFITLTSFAKERFLNSSLNLQTSQLVVKPNSVDDFGVSVYENREDFFLYVGRISVEKGINTLISAFSSVEEQLEIIGDGPLLEDAKKQSGKNIHFHGFQNAEFIKHKLKKCRALIVPSIWYEGLPTTILEAYSTGTPVICSDIDNLNTIVNHNIEGLLFETGNANSLALIIQHFVQSASSSLYFGARKAFENKYSHEKNLSALLSIYKDVQKNV